MSKTATTPEGDDAWERLVRLFSDRPLVLGRPALRSGVNGTVVSGGWRGRSGRGVILTGLAVGLGFACVGAYTATEYGWALGGIWLGFGVLLTVGGVLGLLHVNKAICAPGAAELVVEWGPFPFVHRVEVPTSDLSVELGVAPAEGTWARLAPGTSILHLRRRGNNRTVLLAIAARQEALRHAYNTLAGFLGGSARNVATEEVALPDGSSLTVSTAPLSAPGRVDRLSRLRIASGTRAKTIHVWTDYVLWCIFLLAGALACAALVPLWRVGPLWILWGVVPAVLFLGFAVWGLRSRFGMRPIRIDKEEGMIAVGAGAWGWREFHLQDAAALQVCHRIRDKHGRTSCLELNLVMRQPPGERVHLVGHADDKRLRRDAARLADFLGVPLLDHTGGSDG